MTPNNKPSNYPANRFDSLDAVKDHFSNRSDLNDASLIQEYSKLTKAERQVIDDRYPQYKGDIDKLKNRLAINKNALSAQAHQNTEKLNNDIISKKLDALVRDYPQLAKFKEAGILKNTLENPNKVEKLEKYLSIIDFISVVGRDKVGKIDIKGKQKLAENMLWLQNESSDFIGDKKYIQMKYAEAVYNDVIREGYFIHRHESGKYSIQSPNKELSTIDNQLVPNGSRVAVYEQLLNGTAVTNIYDIAIVSSIIRKDFEKNSGVIGQRSMLSKILERHKITGVDKNNVEQPEFLLMDRDDLITQIDEKLKGNFKRNDGKSDSIQEYQELMFLKSYIGTTDKPGDYINPTYNKGLFTETNEYRQKFLKEKELVDALQANNGNIEATMGEMFKNNSFGLGAIGLLALIFTKHKKMGLAGLAAAVFAQPIGKMIDGGINKVSGVTGIDDDKLELIDPNNLKKSLDNNEYQVQYEKLVDQNNINKKSRVDNNVILPTMDNDRLFSLVNHITNNKIDVDLRDFSKLTKEINNGLTAENIYQPSEIKAFKGLLLGSGIKETSDKTTLDYLSADGRDINNKAYGWETFTGMGEFDDSLNESMKAVFDATDASRYDKQDLLVMGTFMAKELQNIKGWLDNAKKGEFGATELSTRIGNIVSRIENENPELAKKVKTTLENYENYLQVQEKLAKFEGIYDQNEATLKAWLTDAIGIGNSTELWSELNREQKELNSLKITDNSLLTNPIFTALNVRINKLVQELQLVKGTLESNAQNTNISSVRLNPAKDFATESETIGLENQIKEMTNDIQSLSDKIDRKSDVNIVLDELSELKLAFTGLTAYKTAVIGANLTLSTNEEQKIRQENIQKMLTAFPTQKTELQTKVKAYISEYSKNNADKIDTLNSINDNSDILADLDALKKTQGYLSAKGVEMNEIHSKILQSLQDNLGKTYNIVAAQNQAQPNTASNSNVGNVLTALESMKNWTVTKSASIYNSVTDGMSVTDDILNAHWNTFRTEYNEQLVKLNTALRNFNGTEATDTMLELASNARSAFSEGGIDDQYAQLTQVVKVLLGVNVDSVKTISDVKKEYDVKRKEVKEKVLSKITEMDDNYFAGRSSTELKSDYELLEGFKKVSMTLVTSIGSKQHKLFNIFMQEEKMQDFDVLQSAMKDDINLLNTRILDSRYSTHKDKLEGLRDLLKLFLVEGSKKGETIESFNNYLNDFSEDSIALQEQFTPKTFNVLDKGIIK